MVLLFRIIPLMYKQQVMYKNQIYVLTVILFKLFVCYDTRTL